MPSPPRRTNTRRTMNPDNRQPPKDETVNKPRSSTLPADKQPTTQAHTLDKEKKCALDEIVKARDDALLEIRQTAKNVQRETDPRPQRQSPHVHQLFKFSSSAGVVVLCIAVVITFCITSLKSSEVKDIEYKVNKLTSTMQNINEEVDKVKKTLQGIIDAGGGGGGGGGTPAVPDIETKSKLEDVSLKVEYLTTITAGIPQKLNTFENTLNELDIVDGELKKNMIPALLEAKSYIVEVKSDMGTVNTNIQTLGNKITNVADSLSSMRESIGSKVQALVTDLGTTKRQAEETNVERKRKLEDVSLKVDNLTTLTAGLPQKLNTIANTLNELDRVDGELKQNMIPELLEAKRYIVEVKSDMGTVNTNIQTLGNKITNVADSLSSTKESIGSKVQALAIDLGTTKRQAEDALEKVTTLQTNVEAKRKLEDVSLKVEYLTTLTAGLPQKLNTIDNTLNELDRVDGELTNNMIPTLQEAKRYLAEVKSDTGTINTNIHTLGTKITNVADSLSSTKESIGSKVQALVTDLGTTKRQAEETNVETKRKLEDVSLKVEFLTTLTASLPQKLNTIANTLNELDIVDGELKQNMIPALLEAKRYIVEVKSDMGTVNTNIQTLGNKITNVADSLSSIKGSIGSKVQALVTDLGTINLQSEDASEKVTTLPTNVETKRKFEDVSLKVEYLTMLTAGQPQKLNTIVNTLNELYRVDGELTNNMIPALQEAKRYLVEVKSDMGTVNTNIQTLGNKIANVADSLSSTKESIGSKVQALVTDLGTTKRQAEETNVETKRKLEDVSLKVEYLTTLTASLPQKLNTIANTLNELDIVDGEFKQNMIPALLEAKRYIVEVKSDMGTVNTNIQTLGNKITNVADSLSSTKESIGSRVQALVADLGTTKRQAEDALENMTTLQTNVETKRKLEDVNLKVEYLTKLTAGLPQKLNTIDNTLNELDRVDGELTNNMIPALQEAKRYLVEVKSDMGTVNTNIHTLGNKITNVADSLSSTKESIGSKVQALVTDLGTTKRQAEDALEKVTTLQTNVEAKRKLEDVSLKVEYLTTLTAGLPQKLNTIDNTLNELDRVDGELTNNMIPTLQEAKRYIVEVKSDMGTVNTNIQTLGNKITNVADNLSSTKESIGSKVQALVTDLGTTKRQAEETNVEWKRKLEDVSLKVEYVTTLTAGISQKLNTIDNTLNELDRVDGELKQTMIPALLEAKRYIVEVKSDMGTVNNNIQTLGNKITDVADSLSSTKHSIDSEVQALAADLVYTKGQAEDTSMKVTTLQTNVETSTGVLQEGQENLVDVVAGISNLTKEQQEFLNKKIAPNTFNKHATTLVIIIIAVMVVCEAFAIYILCQGQGKGHGVAQGQGRRDPVNGMRGNADNPGRLRRNPILNEIPRDVALERAVCVISLEGTTRALHMDMVRTALGGMAATARVETRDVLVSSHEDILEIPAATVNLLFIHFSERHVILEQPLLGLGDRNITTYQAVKQLGGRLAIVYVRDPGSMRLGEQELYNRDIPVQVTAELQELADQDCFFTTYDRLTPFQNTSLRRFISKYLDRR